MAVLTNGLQNAWKSNSSHETIWGSSSVLWIWAFWTFHKTSLGSTILVIYNYSSRMSQNWWMCWWYWEDNVLLRVGEKPCEKFKALHIPEVSRGPVVWSMPGHSSKVKDRLFLVIFNTVDGNTTNAWTSSFYSRGNMFMFMRPFPVTDWSPKQNGALE